MTAVDSSVVVAACASWHDMHDLARKTLDRGPRLVGHCALEALSVLTRLPAPNRVPAALVIEFLGDWFSDDPLVLSASDMRALPRQLQQLGIAGGAVYDGLVAMTARAHGVELLSLDTRADPTYRRCGVSYRILT